MNKIISLISLVLMIGIFFITIESLPIVGDPHSPASTHVSPHYIEKSAEETGAPNFVAAILADYRGYDTLGENIVIFTAGVSTVLILKTSGNLLKHKGGKDNEK
ncbi:MAG: hypothetical protein GX923_05385 [Clostridia bacterium]|jgi:multicomponent Na+:H+ antiporter subunit B|nr:hypothetical protein [Clostridia bacterium]